MKKFFKGVGLFLFAVLITLAVGGITFARVLTPENIKQLIQKSGAYSGLVDAVIAQAQQDTSQEGDNPLKKPEIQAVAKQAITPAFLQSSVENFIDGSYSWLSGKTAEPTFNIDIAKVKQDFAAGLSTYAVTRYNGLPVCARGQIPDTSDFMNIQCRVNGYDIKPDADKKSQEIVAQIELPGGGNNISPQVLKDEAAKNGQQVFFANTLFPTLFKINLYFPYIFAGIVLLIAVIMLLVSKPKTRGIKNVSISLVLASILLFLFSLGLQQTQTRVIGGMAASDQALAAFGQKTATNIATSVVGQVKASYNMYAIIFAVIGVLAIVLTMVLKGKQGSKPTDDETKPQPDKAPAPAKPVKPAAKTPPKVQ